MLKSVNESVQDFVVAALKEMGLCPVPDALLHTFALSEGRLVAEKFFYDGGYAVWAAGCGTVNFYDEDGGLLKSLGFGAAGAWFAMCFTTVLSGVLIAAWFKWGTWRTLNV